MTLDVFVLLLLSFLMLFLAQLCHLNWTHHQPSHSKAEAMRTTVQRLLKPRTPLDCPACRLSCTPSLAVRPTPTPVRPWREVKSRRGAPKRVNTEGFACPNQQCPYFGITDASIHALVGDGKHGHAEQIQTFRCQACHTTFTARRHTPLYRLKTPSQQIGMVRISRWPKGWMLPLPNGSSATVRPPSPTGYLARAHTLSPCTSTASAISGSRTCNWTNCAPGCATPNRCCGCGWPSIHSRRSFPSSTLVPAHKMPRTYSSTPCVTSWSPSCLPLFTSDGLNLYFYALPGPFWTVV
jgi:hypothetical protein